MLDYMRTRFELDMRFLTDYWPWYVGLFVVTTCVVAGIHYWGKS